MAFCPDFSTMLGDDTLSDRKTEPIAFVPIPALVDSIEAFENIFQVFVRKRVAIAGNRKKAVLAVF